MLALSWLMALFFAMNIGASGTAAAMGEAYGGGAVKSKRLAMVLVGVFALAGAALGGIPVIETIGKGITSADSLNVELIVVILAAACAALFVANMAGIPLSTSEVAVGAVAGVGLASGSLFATKLAFIAFTWLALPLVSFTISRFLVRYLVPLLGNRVRSISAILRWMLVFFGCYEAFAAGMNNAANAVGPLVGAGFVDARVGASISGIFMGIGAVMMGGRVLETNGKRITSLSLVSASVVGFTSATLVILASIFGLPVPLTQAKTAGIIGAGCANSRGKTLQRNVVKSIIWTWVASPLISMGLSYSIAMGFIRGVVPIVPSIVALLIACVGLSVWLPQRVSVYWISKEHGA